MISRDQCKGFKESAHSCGGCSGRFCGNCGECENAPVCTLIVGNHQELHAPKELKKLDADPVNHPAHYTRHPSGVECIQITEWMGFNLGNAMKYLWRADLKFNAMEDMRKAVWYIEREIARREKGGETK